MLMAVAFVTEGDIAAPPKVLAIGTPSAVAVAAHKHLQAQPGACVWTMQANAEKAKGAP